jgi:hypothetical protein
MEAGSRIAYCTKYSERFHSDGTKKFRGKQRHHFLIRQFVGFVVDSRAVLCQDWRNLSGAPAATKEKRRSKPLRSIGGGFLFIWLHT